MKRMISMICIAGFAMQACDTKVKEDNPFFVEYNTPFQIPPFNEIQEGHYRPAFERGMNEHNAEIAAIANSTETPTFENTIEALELSGKLLGKVRYVFSNLYSSDNTDSLSAIAEQIMPALSAHSDAMLLNDKLFTRVKSVYENQNNLTTEQKQVLDKYYTNFVRGGANLNAEQKEELKAINQELSLLSLRFGNNQLAETNAYQLVIDNQEDLSGLPEGVVSAAAEAAKKRGMDGKYVFTLHNPSIIPFLQYADNRDLREQIYKAYINRGTNANDYNNTELISKIVSLRVKKANLLGYKNHADFILSNNMAKSPENVYNLCNQIWEAALPMAKNEAKELQKMADKEGKKIKIQGWDWRYYTEKIRKEKYGIDETMLSEYFPLEQVRQGAFDVATKLWGITFTQRTDVPVPNPAALAFEVKEANGEHIGILFMDFHPRASKRSGAWMNSFRGQSTLLGSTPIITNVCNFTPPTGDKPALLTFDEASTLFHEFGHALHGLLSSCTYPSVAGTAVARDFVELPSQIMENWASSPEVLKTYARHYKTGEVIPDELINKLEAASHFNQGFITTEFMAAALMDMAFHTVEDTNPINTIEFEKNTLNSIGLISEITVRYRPTYFGHIFNGGYSSGYYAYTWAEVLDADAFQAFKESGDLFNQEKAKGFRDNILSKGGSDNPMKLYVQFRGNEPQINALLERKGLN
ncbi:MAG: M3 family metallopeptidase [Marinifilaceae bacterium]